MFRLSSSKINELLYAYPNNMYLPISSSPQLKPDLTNDKKIIFKNTFLLDNSSFHL